MMRRPVLAYTKVRSQSGFGGRGLTSINLILRAAAHDVRIWHTILACISRR